MAKTIVQNTTITIISVNADDYISLTGFSEKWIEATKAVGIDGKFLNLKNIEL